MPKRQPYKKWISTDRQRSPVLRGRTLLHFEAYADLKSTAAVHAVDVIRQECDTR